MQYSISVLLSRTSVLVLTLGLVAGCASPPSRAWESPFTPPPAPAAGEDAPQPFKLPTFSGEAVDYHAVPALDSVEPRMDFDAVFATVLACYPMPSNFRLDVEAQAVANTAELVNLDNSTQGRYYLQVVAKMPLYSTSEVDRVTQFEAGLREKIAAAVGQFFEALTYSRQSHRELGLYSTLESRAQARVQMGIVDTGEQVSYLDKTIAAQAKVSKWDTTADALRIQLSGYCRESVRPSVSAYLAKVQRALGATPIEGEKQ